MFEIKQTEIFQKWEARLKDKRAKVAIAARVFRLANGLMGDVQPVGHGVSELRIHYGARVSRLLPAARDRAGDLAVRGRQEHPEQGHRAGQADCS